MAMAVSVRVSEGKQWPPTGVRVASGKGWCRGDGKGCTRVQARREQGKSKKWGWCGLKQGNVATCECNVTTFQRGK